MDTLVSVILPVCNSSSYLQACLDSLLRQKHDNIEIIAIDDNSKDASRKILREYRKIDKRLKFSANVKRYGLAITLNRAIKKARGDFIAFMNPHDVNSVWRIKKQLEFLKRNPKVVAVGTQTIAIDEAGKTMEKPVKPADTEVVYHNFLHGLTIQFESIMINKRLIPRDLLYFSQHKYPFVYIEAFVKLFRYGKFASLMQQLYYHRGKPVTVSKLNPAEQTVQQLLLFIRSFTRAGRRLSNTTPIGPLTVKTKTVFR